MSWVYHYLRSTFYKQDVLPVFIHVKSFQTIKSPFHSRLTTSALYGDYFRCDDHSIFSRYITSFCLIICHDSYFETIYNKKVQCLCVLEDSIDVFLEEVKLKGASAINTEFQTLKKCLNKNTLYDRTDFSPNITRFNNFFYN